MPPSCAIQWLALLEHIALQIFALLPDVQQAIVYFALFHEQLLRDRLGVEPLRPQPPDFVVHCLFAANETQHIPQPRHHSSRTNLIEWSPRRIASSRAAQPNCLSHADLSHLPSATYLPGI